MVANGQDAASPSSSAKAPPPKQQPKNKAKAGSAAANKKSDGDVGNKSPASAMKSDVSLLLAHNYDGSQNVHQWWCSEKLDGVRAFWDGSTFRSRAGNTFHVPQFFFDKLPKTHHLDGELFLGRGDFQLCVGTVKKHKPVEAEWRRLKYCVFDVIPRSGGDAEKTFEDRMAEGKELLKNCDYAEWHEHGRVGGGGGGTPGEAASGVGPAAGAAAGAKAASSSKKRKRSESGLAAPDDLSATIAWLDAELKRVETLGGEGLMLRQPGSLYERKRSNTLLKVKSFEDIDCEVVKVEIGKGANKNRMGALFCKDAAGVQFKVGTGFKETERENPPQPGEIISIKFQERTKDSKPRFPVFLRRRPDLKKLEG